MTSRSSTATTLRLTSLAAAAAFALFIAISFLCAAAFIYVLQNYGLIEACLVGAAMFLVITLIAAGGYMIRKRQINNRVVENEKSALQTALADPMLVATGLQIIRAIGIKKLLPILAVGGLALGLMASRHTPAGDQTPAE